MAFLCSLLVFALAPRATAARMTTPCSAVVTTPFGTVQGNLLHDGTGEFLGIPFAVAERFMPPMPWTKHFGHLTATAFTPACTQQPPFPGTPAIFLPVGMSEDCLHLNVWTPARRCDKGAAPLPVLLWIHGGGLQTGSAMLPENNGTRLAASQDVILVSINYRLNVFGFTPLVLSDGTVLSNNGFRDQREAMRWVRGNIAAFGGDPHRVTIFGESAGGQSVATHLVSPGSAGLFDGAISESGDIINTRSLSQALGLTAIIADAVGCPPARSAGQLRCLQRANSTQILDYYMADSSTIAAVVDGDVLPLAPVEQVQRGSFNKVPTIVGNNADEAAFWVYLLAPGQHVMTAAQARCAYSLAFGDGDVGQTLAGLYPIREGIDNRPMAVEMLSDINFHCGNRRFARALAEAGAPTWTYSFRRRSPCPLLAGAPGAYHSSEIDFVFGNTVDLLTALGSNCSFPPADVALSAQIGRSWAAFARDGKPPAAWPMFDTAVERSLLIDVGMSMASADSVSALEGYRRGQCAVVDALGLNWTTMVDFTSAMAKCT